MQSIIVEVAMFKLNEGVTDQAFIAEAEKVQESFLKIQKGYLDRGLLKDENGQWFDILHWASMEDAQTAARVMMQESECQPFIQMINSQSIQMFHLVRQREWSMSVFREQRLKLQKYLRYRANAETKAWWENYVKESAPFMGVKMPVIRTVLHQWYKENVEGILEYSEQLELALSLFDGEYTEEKLAGTLFLRVS